MYSCWVDTVFGLENWDSPVLSYVADNWEGLLTFILIIGLMIHFGVFVELSHRKAKARQKAIPEKMDELLSYQFTLIQFTKDKNVSPETARLWDNLTRKIAAEVGWSDELYDENRESVMLELGLDTSWWKE